MKKNVLLMTAFTLAASTSIADPFASGMIAITVLPVAGVTSAAGGLYQEHQDKKAFEARLETLKKTLTADEVTYLGSNLNEIQQLRQNISQKEPTFLTPVAANTKKIISTKLGEELPLTYTLDLVISLFMTGN